MPPRQWPRTIASSATKNTMNSLVSRWASAEIALEGKLVPILQELEQKAMISSPTDADKARISELIWQRNDLRAQMEAESENLRTSMILVEVEPRCAGKGDGAVAGLDEGHHPSRRGVPVGHGDNAHSRRQFRCQVPQAAIFAFHPVCASVGTSSGRRPDLIRHPITFNRSLR